MVTGNNPVRTMANPASRWPLQRDCDAFYGNPRAGAVVSQKWYRENIIMVVPPFRMAMGAIPIKRFPFHRKCADALRVALDDIWERAGRDQRVIDQWGMSVFSGTFNYRPMRGGSALSMHAYACAADFDAPRNALGDRTPHFANVPQVLAAFRSVGAIWGGDWNGNGDTLDERRCDGMHWQFARLG